VEGAEAVEQSPRASRLAGLTERLRASRLGWLGDVAVANLRDPVRVFALLLLTALVLRALWLTVPARGLIFDEAYYVNAARVVLGLPATSHYADSPVGLDPNTEHPPLGKLAIAASMAVFGDNGLGWRLPSLIAAMVALLVVYQIVRATDRSAWLAVLVVGVLSLDNLTFVHGRIGTLDMLVLAPMLIGSWLGIQRRWLLAGLAMGLALLVKLTALYGIAAVILYFLLTDGAEWWRRRGLPPRDSGGRSLRGLAGPVLFVAVTLAVALGGLAALDTRFTSFSSPLAHIERMVSYGAALRAPATAGFCPEADSRPWQWLFNECQIQYLRVDVTVRAGEEVVARVPRIDFRGALNPLLAGAIPLAGLFAGWYAWRTRSRVALWAVAWAAANYLPYVVLAIFTSRIMYLYYALPLVPAVAIAIGLLLLRAGLPRPVRWGFLLAYLAGFMAYFPFRQIP
jgi:4-amino-4-deoxy-L-arabinose transferase-like glycosyltransferase